MTAPAARRSSNPGGPPDPRSLARLNAIQALYEIQLSGRAAAQVIGDFKAGRQTSDVGEVLGTPDWRLFEFLVTAATGAAERLDRLVGDKLADGRPAGHREALLAVILRCGAAELDASPELPISVIVNEYVDAAHAFYGGREPALVNAVLDAVGKSLRGVAPASPDDDAA